MKRMSRRIFLNMFILAALVLISSTILTVGIVYKNFSRQNTKMLQNELSSIANGVEINGIDFLITFESRHRITLIDKDGKVIYDNEKTSSLMDNHNSRKEVREAREKGTGYSERYSDTLSEKTINVTILLKDQIVLRVSDTLSTVWFVVLDILAPILVVMLMAIVLAAFLAYRMSRSITKPINELNLATPEKKEVYEEIEPLIDKINEQNRQIHRQMKELKTEHERQDHLRRDFTANVSHELKTPLTSISGFAEIIQNGIVKDEDVRRFAGKIHDESQRLIILVGDIIKLSQLDGNDISVKMEPIDLYETSQAVMSHLEAAADKKNVGMKLTGNHAVITGAEQIIEEMIFNLVDNAIKYNRDGGNVAVNIERTDLGIELTVSDNGIGISEEDKDRIFERFFRVDKSHSKEIGGTGLGLSIVKHGAVFHNASLTVESKLGEGTKMKIVF
ncbi:MAG: sensor histidine kinase [Eubacterium sp.]